MQGGDKAAILRKCNETMRVEEKSLPQNWEDFCAHVRERCKEKGEPEPDFSVAFTEDELGRIEVARSALDAHQNRRDDVIIAQSLLHFVAPLFCETWATSEAKEGTPATPLEWFDTKEKRWHAKGGEAKLKMEISRVTRELFTEFELTPMMDHVRGYEKEVWLPTAVKSSGVCGNWPMLSTARDIIRTIMKTDPAYKLPPLNDECGNNHLIHYACGMTLDFTPFRDSDNVWRAKPFAQQLRPGRAEDRNAKTTGRRWESFEGGVADRVIDICARYVKACEDWGQFFIDCQAETEDVEELLNAPRDVEQEEWAAAMRRDLDELRASSVLLDFFFGSHKEYDVVFYELLFWARAICGRKNFEEFMYIYGKSGSNAKGARIKLLLQALGDSKSGNGYIAVLSSTYFTQAVKEVKPDESAAAAKGCRVLIVDETGGGSTAEGARPLALNAPLMKQWCDAAGTPFPFQRKYGAQETMTVTWTMFFYGNVRLDVKHADAAFKKRPALLEIATRFVAADKYDPTDKTHVLERTDYKDDDFVRTMVPELMLWIRCLVPALYTKHMRHHRKLRPVPASVMAFTSEELGTEADTNEDDRLMKEVRVWVERNLKEAEPLGRGKKTDLVIPKTIEVHAKWNEQNAGDISSVLKRFGWKGKASGGRHVYVSDNGKYMAWI